MRQEQFNEPHKLGLERLTGDNSGLFYTNEQTSTVPDSETGEEKTIYTYDVYEVPDVRQKSQVKNSVIEEEHPFGDETKILRKTIAKMLKAAGTYDSTEFAEFKAYDEFCEGVRV